MGASPVCLKKMTTLVSAAGVSDMSVACTIGWTASRGQTPLLLCRHCHASRCRAVVSMICYGGTCSLTLSIKPQPSDRHPLRQRSASFTPPSSRPVEAEVAVLSCIAAERAADESAHLQTADLTVSAASRLSLRGAGNLCARGLFTTATLHSWQVVAAHGCYRIPPTVDVQATVQPQCNRSGKLGAGLNLRC
jgi:hypothetical protein